MVPAPLWRGWFREVCRKAEGRLKPVCLLFHSPVNTSNFGGGNVRRSQLPLLWTEIFCKNSSTLDKVNEFWHGSLRQELSIFTKFILGWIGIWNWKFQTDNQEHLIISIYTFYEINCKWKLRLTIGFKCSCHVVPHVNDISNTEYTDKT